MRKVEDKVVTLIDSDSVKIPVKKVPISQQDPLRRSSPRLQQRDISQAEISPGDQIEDEDTFGVDRRGREKTEIAAENEGIGVIEAEVTFAAHDQSQVLAESRGYQTFEETEARAERV